VTLPFWQVTSSCPMFWRLIRQRVQVRETTPCTAVRCTQSWTMLPSSPHSARGSHACNLQRAMPERTMTERLENLEKKMELLERLPERVSAVELQILHIRSEMHGQFSAVRSEMHEQFSAVRGEMHEQFSAVRDELHTEIEETRRYMRVLHEEVLSRIAVIQEGHARRRRR
jgi:hypothetical protein